MSRVILITVAILSLAACSGGDVPPPQTGPGDSIELPEPHRGIMPKMVIAEPAGWGDKQPIVPDGYRITAIATDLGIPRQTLILPNGDILVAEGRGGNAPKLKPKDVIAGYIKAQGTTSVPSGNRLTLLRDADGDGVYELQTPFAENLNAPYGLALIDDSIYVAAQDAVVRFDYQVGQTQASGPPEELVELPHEINHHWTKAMTASADGRYLFVGIGSNSNAGERGTTAEVDRAVVWQIDVETGMHKAFVKGIRNPSALATHPETGAIWAAVNERDEIGPNLVPDYLAELEEGQFYGWPYAYWGPNPDPRSMPQNDELVAQTVVPDYSLGSHVAALGLDFSHPSMGGRFASGAFVGEHGSWNRADPVGYKVVFVRFENGRPVGEPIDFVTGFREDDGTTYGRPVGVTVDPRGALIVCDDLSNTVWRVTQNN